MTSLLTKRKLFIIATCIFLVTLSTILFLVGEDQLHLDHNEIKADVLHEEEVSIIKDEPYYRELLEIEEDDFFILDTDILVSRRSSESSPYN